MCRERGVRGVQSGQQPKLPAESKTETPPMAQTEVGQSVLSVPFDSSSHDDHG